MVPFTGKGDRKVYLPGKSSREVTRNGEPVISQLYVQKERLEVERLDTKEAPKGTPHADAEESVEGTKDLSPDSASSEGTTAAASSAGKKRKLGGPKRSGQSS